MRADGLGTSDVRGVTEEYSSGDRSAHGEVSRKGSMHPKNEKLGGSLCKVSW